MRILLRLTEYSRRYLSWLILACLAMTGGSLLQLATPLITKQIIDVGIARGDTGALARWSGLIIVVAIFSGLLRFARIYVIAHVSQGAVYSLRNDLYRSLLYRSFSYYDRSRSGQLISRVTSDVRVLEHFLAWDLVEVINILVTVLGISTLLFIMNWQLTLVALAITPPVVFSSYWSSTRLHRLYRLVRRQFGEVTSALQENISGIRVVRAFSREDYEIDKFSQTAIDHFRKLMDTVRVWSFFVPLMMLISGLGVISIIWVGGWLVMNGRLTLGGLVAFHGYLLMFVWPVQSIGRRAVHLNRAYAAGERIFDIIDTPGEVTEKPSALELTSPQGRVVFENVSFEYEADQEVLRDISLVVEPGQVIALLGATGSGKTSIINLIPRFYDVSAGRVTIDGHDVRDLTLNSLRRNIGMVFQETFLFSSTIRENVAYGRSEAGFPEVAQAAKLAQAHEFIMSFPQGYDTPVGERGITVSGGQRQRIAIARALLLNPRILIMDDSTSSVDPETEQLIQQALAEAMRGRTVFVIAHRLSTIKNADKIVVLDRGRIAEMGTHDELLQKGGIYSRIYQAQFSEQEKELVGIEAG